MVDGRFLIAGGGCFGFSFMLFILLKVFPDVIKSATTPEGITWIYFIHMASAGIGVILLLIGIFKRKPSA